MGTLFALLVLGFLIGADAQSSGIYGEEFVVNESLDTLSKQPIVYNDLPFECIEYTLETTSASTNKEAPLLSYIQTSDQFDGEKADRTDEYVRGSVCVDGNCNLRVQLPKEDVRKPFYIILVNARHTTPLQEAPAEETVDVTVIVKSCDNRDSSKVITAGSAGKIENPEDKDEDEANEDGDDDGDKDLLIIILVCVLGGVFLLLCILIVYCKRKPKYTKSQYNYPQKIITHSDTGAPLAEHQPQEMDSPVGGIEHPVPPAAYEPPSRDSPVSEPGRQGVEAPVAAPTKVFHNSLWGRLMSKRGSVKLKTIGTYAERQGAKINGQSESQDVENPPWPEPEGSNQARVSSEVNDGQVPPGFPEEGRGNANKSVFFNSVFSRVRSGFQGSFKSFTSFGDRGDRNSGVKLKSMTSMLKAKGRNQPIARSAPEAISEGVERTSSASTPVAQYTPDRLAAVAEDNAFPGAEHLQMSSEEDEENTSPFATPEVQTVAASYIND